MADHGLLRPGAHLTSGLLSDEAVTAALLRVERAWTDVLAERTGRDPARVHTAVDALEGDLGPLTRHAAENALPAGQPVLALLEQVGRRVPEVDDDLVHLGLSAQDALDTALVLLSRGALDRAAASLRGALAAGAALAREHRDTLMLGRTLTQPAVPTTAGAMFAGWLGALMDAQDEVRAARTGLHLQYGGTAGTSAALLELGLGDPGGIVTAWGHHLGLTAPAVPWQTNRLPVLRIGSACAAVVAACGHLAGDVLVRSRPEIGELSEARDRRSPALAAAVRRYVLTAPGDLAALHVAAGLQEDQRTAGAWQAQWQPWRDLLEAAAVTAALVADLLETLVVHPERMARSLDAALPGALAEQGALRRSEPGRDPAGYLGEARELTDRVLLFLEERWTQ